MFPAYRGGRGGGGGGGGRGRHHHQHHQSNRGHYQGQGQNWDAPDGPSGGFMIDRGGPGPSASYNAHGSGGGGRGGGDRRSGGRGGSHNQWGHNSGQGRRSGGGGDRPEVVDIDGSDDDNVVYDAARSNNDNNDNRRKRHRSGSSSRSHKRKKRDRSRSPESRHGHREERHHHSGERNRSHGHNERGDRGRDGHGQRGQDNRGWGNNLYQQGQGYSEWNPNVPVALPPPLMGMAPPPPWMLDNNPMNPFDHFQMQQQRTGGRGDFNDHDHRGRGGNYGMDHDSRDRGHRDGRGQGNERGDRSGRASRWDDGFQAQEQRRLQISSGFPKKVFLEEVNLNSEFAFRLDTSSNPGLINYRSIAMSQKSTYEGGVGGGILGATEDEISKVYSKFHAVRCKPPASMNEDEDSEKSEDDKDKKEIQKQDSSAKSYISIGKDDGQANTSRGPNDRFDTSRDFDSFSFERKDGEMNVQERTEYYNKEVRNQPNNISLWIEFVKFQDKVFEESSMIFGQSDAQGQRSKKKKNNRKTLLEKKIAILEKALESNPNCLVLHLQRLECLLDLYKPRHVLTEWKKLVLQHQQSAPFWIEYLMFSASQLLIYSNSSTLTIFDTCFQKFRLMMNPQYPEFQRPRKFLLFTADVTFGLGLLLKNAGYLERAIALHQAQLEFDFHCPKDLLNGDTVQNWKEIAEAFDTYWETGTPRFGETGSQGWEFYVENTPKDRQLVTLSDSLISQFEEDTFETINERLKGEADESEEDGKNLRSIKYDQKSNIWTSMESCRSKLYWLPWRELCSDVDDCEDAQRVVPSSSILNFLCPLPNEANFISQFDKSAAHFRHLINFLMTLREDFIPHTQSIDFVCSPFFSTTLTESSSLFTEIYYWRKLIDIYVEANTPENASKFHHVFAPEGFKLQDLVSPNLTTAEILKPTIFDVTLKTQSQLENSIAPPGEEEPDVYERKLTLLRDNNTKYMDMFYRVLGIGLEKLDPEFSCILFEMLLRFEQKLTCTEPGNIKQRIKYAKGLMKNEKLRNAIGGYRELAMLEYFGGGLDKAVALLLKTIDATSKSLESDEWDQINWDQDWKLLVDLISLYRQLVELYLRNGTSENDSKAYYTLIQLGNCFKPIDPDFLGKINEKEQDGEGQQWTPKKNLLLKASRSFEKIMAMLIPNINDESDELLEKDVYYKWGGENCVEFLLQQRNLIVECTCCYALFQFLSKGFDEACLVYESVLKRLNSEQFKTRENYNPELIRFHIREQLYINWCNLAARCLMKDPLMNSKFRSILSKALEEFPSSPPLLILFTDVENQTSVAGKLWRLMMNNMKPDSDKMVTQWAPLIMGIGLARKIEELEHDEEVGLPVFGLGGPAVPQDTIFYKLDSMISVAEQHPGIRNCPLLWRVHLKMLALRSLEGKDVERAKKTFYEAVRHCPSSKSIYLDGVAYFPELLQEVNELMAEKQLLVRLPLLELDVLLELDEENGSIASKGEGEEEEEEEENEDESNDKGKISVGKRKVRESKSEGEIGDSD